MEVGKRVFTLTPNIDPKYKYLVEKNGDTKLSNVCYKGAKSTNATVNSSSVIFNMLPIDRIDQWSSIDSDPIDSIECL